MSPAITCKPGWETAPGAVSGWELRGAAGTPGQVPGATARPEPRPGSVRSGGVREQHALLPGHLPLLLRPHAAHRLLGELPVSALWPPSPCRPPRPLPVLRPWQPCPCPCPTERCHPQPRHRGRPAALLTAASFGRQQKRRGLLAAMDSPSLDTGEGYWGRQRGDVPGVGGFFPLSSKAKKQGRECPGVWLLRSGADAAGLGLEHLTESLSLFFHDFLATPSIFTG